MNDVKVKLDRPIGSVTLINEKEVQALCAEPTNEKVHQQQQRIQSLCSALEKAAAATEQSIHHLFESQKGKIIRLSMEIAAKILAKDIREGNYDIQDILLDAIKPIPVTSHMLVRLHPGDLEVLRQAVKNNALQLPEKLRFVDDPGVGPAECIVESDEGVVEHLIDDHLKQIEAVLSNTLNEVTQS
jgi:flagellar biosynthesis/type III secretory pathway protein FliH